MVAQQKNSIDKVTLVNERDEVIGELDKVEAHRGEGQRHRAVSVYLFRKTNEGLELLIQQRAAQKIVGANLWANTICGNVRPTESYEECAHRRLREELGITEANIAPVYKFEYHMSCGGLTKEAVEANPHKNLKVGEQFSEWEMDQVFFGWYNEEVDPNDNEVQDFRWEKWDKLMSFESFPVEYAPWFVLMLNDEDLVQILNQRLS